MADLPLAHHIINTAPAIAACAKTQGFNTMEMILSGIGGMVIGGTAGWFAGRRGLTGVQTDLANVKKEIEKLTGQSTAPAAA